MAVLGQCVVTIEGLEGVRAGVAELGELRLADLVSSSAEVKSL